MGELLVWNGPVWDSHFKCEKAKKSAIFVKSNFFITSIFEEVHTSEYLHAMLL